MTSEGGGRARWSDRPPPVLVKDVRASLRGKMAPCFLLAALALQLAWALWILVWRREEQAALGPSIFLGAAQITSTLTALFIPIWAMSSLGEELDGHVEELALVPRLGGWNVVVAKFLAALVLSMLPVCTLLLFGTFAVQLGGVSIVSVLLHGSGVLVQGASASAIGLALAATVRARWARAFAMVALLAWNAFEHSYLLDTLRHMSTSASDLLAVELTWFVLGLLHALLFCGLLLSYAAGCLMHAEESRSTLLRKWGLAIVLVTFVGTTATALLGVSVGNFEWYVERALYFGALVVFLVATEPDRLPRTHRVRPDAGLLRGIHDVLFVSGGGRGAAYTFVLIALAVANAVLLRILDPTSIREWYQRPGLLVLVPSVFLLVPAGAFAKRNTTSRTTLRLRLAIGTACVASGVLMLLTTVRAARLHGPHTPLPAYGDGLLAVLLEPFGFDEAEPLGRASLRDVKNGLWLLFVLAALVLNVPRIVRGAREVGALRSPSRVEDAASQP